MSFSHLARTAAAVLGVLLSLSYDASPALADTFQFYGTFSSVDAPLSSAYSGDFSGSFTLDPTVSVRTVFTSDIFYANALTQFSISIPSSSLNIALLSPGLVDILYNLGAGLPDGVSLHMGPNVGPNMLSGLPALPDFIGLGVGFGTFSNIFISSTTLQDAIGALQVGAFNSNAVNFQYLGCSFTCNAIGTITSYGPVSAVTEPPSLSLLCLGFVGFTVWRFRHLAM